MKWDHKPREHFSVPVWTLAQVWDRVSVGSMGSAGTLGYLKNGFFLGCAWGQTQMGGWTCVFGVHQIISIACISVPSVLAWASQGPSLKYGDDRDALEQRDGNNSGVRALSTVSGIWCVQVNVLTITVSMCWDTAWEPVRGFPSDHCRQFHSLNNKSHSQWIVFPPHTKVWSSGRIWPHTDEKA